MQLIGSDMILADLHDGNLFWNSECRTYSLTSGPRSPPKMENSGPRSSLLLIMLVTDKCLDDVLTYLRSASPPPDAQLSLNGRFEFGICEPLRASAFPAASAVWKSTQQ